MSAWRRSSFTVAFVVYGEVDYLASQGATHDNALGLHGVPAPAEVRDERGARDESDEYGEQ